MTYPARSLTPETAHVSRRTMMKAGAWSVPVIALAAAAPLASASTQCLPSPALKYTPTSVWHSFHGGYGDTVVVDPFAASEMDFRVSPNSYTFIQAWEADNGTVFQPASMPTSAMMRLMVNATWISSDWNQQVNDSSNTTETAPTVIVQRTGVDLVATGIGGALAALNAQIDGMVTAATAALTAEAAAASYSPDASWSVEYAANLTFENFSFAVDYSPATCTPAVFTKGAVPV